MSDRRAATLEAFATLLGLPPLARLAQRGRDPESARYTLELADGRSVRIGTIRVLWSQTELARVLAVTLGCVPPVLDRESWRNAIGALIAHAVDVDEAPGERFEDAVREWLLVYAEHATGDREGAAPRGLPFCDDAGVLHVAANALARYIRREFSEQVKLTELRQALADLGFERCNVSYAKRGGRSSTSYYRLELDALAEEADL